MRRIRLDSFRARLSRFGSDARGASAVEFAIVSAPFLFMLLYGMQIGLYYMTQSALDAGVVRQADALQNGFNTVPVSMPAASALKASVATLAGGLVRNDTTLVVELRQLSNLSAALVPLNDGTVDYGSSTSVLVLRAQSSVFAFAPGFSALQKVTATSIIRRQGR